MRAIAKPNFALTQVLASFMAFQTGLCPAEAPRYRGQANSKGGTHSAVFLTPSSHELKHDLRQQLIAAQDAAMQIALGHSLPLNIAVLQENIYDITLITQLPFDPKASLATRMSFSRLQEKIRKVSEATKELAKAINDGDKRTITILSAFVANTLEEADDDRTGAIGNN
jgi:hypothetical protein